MVHREVYFKFKSLFPSIDALVSEYFPNGKNSIRVRTKNHCDYVFTYNDADDWRFETVDSFIKTMKRR